MRDFDVTVIGAGLGGLSAAAFLAKEGKRVVLLEKHNVPGGYASTFVRGRFEFEISLHELSGLGDEVNRGPIWRLLKGCDVLDKVEFLSIPEFYRNVSPDVDVTVPVGREEFEEEMSRQFPGDAEGIKEFSQIMFEFTEEALQANRVGMKEVMKEPEKYPTLMKYFGKSLSDVLNPLVHDEKARAVLCQPCGYYCQPPSTLSFLIYALGTASYLRFGPSHIKGKSQALSQAFVDTIEEKGSEVWLNKGAARILVSGGKVSGVLTEDGTEVSCPYVVSNANPITTCLDLIGPDETPGWYLKRLGAGSGGASTMNVYAGLDCPYTELGLTCHETFVNTQYDLDGEWERSHNSLQFEPDYGAVTTYNAADPEFSPPGTTSVVITLISGSRPWVELPPEEYVDAKNRVADGMIRLAERIAPDFRKHIEEIEVATPITNARYTGNIGGSIIGFNETFQGTGLERVPNRGPLDGLYFASAWVFIGGGYEPSMVSGYRASREVLKDMEAGGRDAATREKLESKVIKQAGDAEELTASPAARMREAIERWHPRQVRLEVSEVIEETPSTRTLRVVPAEGQLPLFRAGQYINLFVEIEGVLTSRPFSIASAPGRPYFDITVRRVDGGFVSNYLLDRVKKDDVFDSTAPSGSFYHEPLMDTDDLVFLAGGSGITPFASMIREAAGNGSGVNMHLIYGSRVPSDIIFEEELMELAERNPNVAVDLVMSEPPEDWSGPSGLLDAQMISSLVGSVEGKTFFICGPNAMYPLCEGALNELGVPRRHVRREVYGPLADVTKEPGWPGLDPDTEFELLEERSGRSLRIKAGEPLMNSLEREGIVLPTLCRAGECSACRTRLLEGKVFAPERVRLRWSDEHAGYIHPCMSYPIEDLRIRI